VAIVYHILPDRGHIPHEGIVTGVDRRENRADEEPIEKFSGAEVIS